MRLAKLVTVLAAMALLATSLPALAVESGPRELTLTPVVSGLATPVDLRAPLGDERLFVLEIDGRVRLVKNGALVATPFLDIRSRVLHGGERGLLGLAFHPNYSSNGKFYVYYTDNGGDVRISEFLVSSGNPDRADSTSERILLEISQPYSNHNGGGLAFGPSGLLYIAVGDGGGGGDPGEHGQNTNTLLGSLLRIDVDSQDAGLEYAIPPSNPFAGGGGRAEIYAFGLRNPWRISADDATGQIYIGDVGQDRREEINTLTDTESQAVNFGWDVMEGSLCFEPSSGCNKSGKRLPIVEYDNPDEGISVIGGHVYRGHAIPWLRGTYFYSDLTGRRLMSFRYEDGVVRDHIDWTSQVGLIPSTMYSFGVDGLGEVYVLSGSTVYRIDAVRSGRCDFDGDGDSDLAAGIPGENIGATPDAGAVLELPSVNGKPGGTGDEFWQQDDAGIDGVAEPDDAFGSALECGDFDGDGYDDLAIGVPDDRQPSGTPGGAVAVFFGSGSGLSGENTLIHQNTTGVQGGPEAGDAFGAAVAAGDFDGDGYDDLAIGVPGEDVGALADAGTIHLLFGSSSGLVGNGTRTLHQDSVGVQGLAEADDRFGAALTTADFNGDGYADLAVGSPGEDIGAVVDAGLVHVFSGRRSGITVTGDVVLHQNVPGVNGGPESGDAFGSSLAGGPFDADGYDELAVGVANESVNGHAGAGLVQVFRGSSGGITTEGDRIIHQGVTGIQGGVEPGDAFGYALASGDVDGDGFHDLAIGIPLEDVAGAQDAGAAAVIYGSATGLSSRDHLWHQNRPGVLGTDETGDRFGHSVALLDFEEDARLDLVVGIPFEDLAGIADAGDTAILFGRSGGTTGSGSARLSENTTGVQGISEIGDMFGYALAD